MRRAPARHKAHPSVVRRTAIAAVLGLVAAMVAVLTFSVSPAGATHYRATQLTWHQVAGNTVEFHGDGAWRCTFFFPGCTSGGAPAPGTPFAAGVIDFGDTSSVNGQWTVVSVDTVNDVVTGSLHMTHTYPGPGPWKANLEDCCRLSGPRHINNPDGFINITTIVDVAATSASPESTIAPVVDCGLNSVCQFFVPAFDPDGNSLSYRLATPAEAGLGSFTQPGPPHAPNPATIDPLTGLYRWNTTGATLNLNPGDTYYSTQVIVEEISGGGVVTTHTAVDFFIRLTTTQNQQPVFTPPTPADGTVFDIPPGVPFSFNVEATDPDAADTVTLGIINAPPGSSFPNVPGNPANGSFIWNAPATGTYIMNLTAQDQNGLGATPRSITIKVADPTVPARIDDVTVTEGNAGVTPAVFTVSLDSPAPGPVSIDFQTVDGSATAPSDYVATSGTVSFAPGEQSKPVEVSVNGDLTSEPDEAFTVVLTNPVGATLDDPVGVGTIENDDRNGAFWCRAFGAKTGPTLHVQANPPGTPCVDDDKTVLHSPLSPVSYIKVVHANTDQTPNSLAAPPAVGDSATALAETAAVNLVNIVGITITASAVDARASATCTTVGGVPTLKGSSKVAGLKIGTLNLSPIIDKYTKIQLPGVMTVELNKQTIAGGKLIQQAIVITSPFIGGGPIVIGQAEAGYVGNPCAV